MRMINSNKEFELFEHETESEMKEYINSKKGIVISDKCKDKVSFYSVTIKSDNYKKVGFIGDAHGVVPSFLHYPTRNLLLIAIDEIVYFINLQINELTKLLEFDSIVYTMLNNKGKSLFVVCELGVSSVSVNGDLIWNHVSDVITDFHNQETAFEINTDESKYLISKEDGKVMKD